MRLRELCQLAGTDIEISTSPHDYCVTLAGYDGYVWTELEAYADSMEGGTTFSWGRGETPNDALRDWCDKAKGKLLVFQRSGEKRRLIRAPEELTL